MSSTDTRIYEFMKRKELQYPELRKSPARMYRNLIEDTDELIDDVHVRSSRPLQKQLLDTPYYRALLGV
jgi:NTP pyrophosphatase (non-canonical NTP hydrolase)